MKIHMIDGYGVSELDIGPADRLLDEHFLVLVNLKLFPKTDLMKQST